jgi:hypothetical protein
VIVYDGVVVVVVAREYMVMMERIHRLKSEERERGEQKIARNEL